MEESSTLETMFNQTRDAIDIHLPKLSFDHQQIDSHLLLNRDFEIFFGFIIFARQAFHNRLMLYLCLC